MSPEEQLKGLRFIFVKSHEDLPEDARMILRNMRGDFQDLGDAYMFMEALRTIYSRAKTSDHANIAFHRWCKLAEETNIPELKTMARTIRNKLDGIISFWTFRHISNAKMEGFNNNTLFRMRFAKYEIFTKCARFCKCLANRVNQTRARPRE